MVTADQTKNMYLQQWSQLINTYVASTGRADRNLNTYIHIVCM